MAETGQTNSNAVFDAATKAVELERLFASIERLEDGRGSGPDYEVHYLAETGKEIARAMGEALQMLHYKMGAEEAGQCTAGLVRAARETHERMKQLGSGL